jgi:hypothetical protein
MKIALGTFARHGIESQLGSDDVAGAVLAALCHYGNSLKAGRPPLAPPDFLVRAEAGRTAQETLEVAVDPEIEATLRAEARRRGIGLEQIATHSVLVYLAELDFLGSASSRPL